MSGRVLNVTLEIEPAMMNSAGGTVPQVGCEMEGKEKFWSNLYEVGRVVI